MRQKWLELYAETGSVTKTALRCGIARSTLYRWINREKEQGKSELSDKSKRPSRLANMKITPEIETIILNLRKTRSATDCQLSAQKENKALSHDGVACVEKASGQSCCENSVKKSDYIRYSKEIPGERVQLDDNKVRTEHTSHGHKMIVPV